MAAYIRHNNNIKYNKKCYFSAVPSDIWRYYFLAHRPETSDSEFDWDSFISANNNALVKIWGILSTALSSLPTHATIETLCLTRRSTTTQDLEEHRERTT